MTTKPGKTGLFGGVLLKQNFGLRDIWCDRDKPRHEIGQAIDAIAGAILDDLLENRRAIWTERFLLMALWARAAKSQKDGRYWRDFTILAHELSDGRKLAEVPIMSTIAQRTVSVASSEAPF